MTTASPFFEIFARQLLGSAPTLLVCVVACTLILLEWTRGGRASLWALLGFGLAALLVIAGPLVSALAAQMMSGPGGPGRPQPALFLPLVSLGLGLLHALAYGFLLLAVLAGRAPRPPGK